MKIIIRLFFLLIVLANLSVSLPPPSDSDKSLWSSFLNLNRTYLASNFFRSLERSGFHNRWNMFTHSFSEKDHPWYNVFYRVEVMDANKRITRGKFPPDDWGGFFKHYADYRYFRYMANFWSAKLHYLSSLERYYAKKHLESFPDSKFPLEVRILAISDKIPAPNSSPIATSEEVIAKSTYSKAQVYCATEKKL